MRFMIIRKADEETEAGALPTPELMAAMSRYHDELIRAGVLRGGEGLGPSSLGALVTLGRTAHTVTDGPFTEAKELVAGFTMIEVDSLADAVALVEKWPVEDGHGNVELEIRRVHESEDFGDALTPELRAQEERQRASTGNRQGGGTGMRFMVIVRTDERSEAGVMPSQEELEAMGRYKEELVKAGVMLAGDGLHPSVKGARVTFTNGRPTVVDGPFAEAKELIAGFWILEVKSKEEAVEWVKRIPCAAEGETVVEIRQVLEPDDFGEAFSEELRARAEAQRAFERKA